MMTVEERNGHQWDMFDEMTADLEETELDGLMKLAGLIPRPDETCFEKTVLLVLTYTTTALLWDAYKDAKGWGTESETEG